MKKSILSLIVVFAGLMAPAQVANNVDTTGFRISIPSFADLRAVSGDTIYMSSGGGMPQGELIHIYWAEVENISVRQCYQTSVQISLAGNVHRELKNFMNGYTAWENTVAVDSAVVLLKEPEFKGKLPFPSVSQAKLRAAAKSVVDDPKLINKITTPYASPCSVYYSGIVIEVTGTDRTTGNPLRKIVVVELPLSC